MGARNFLVISLILAVTIVYGSLYPFHFHPGTGAGPVQTLLASWPHRPGKVDFLSNILLYMPFGFFCFLAAGEKIATPLRIGIAMVCGVALSAAMELVQYYDPGRDTELADIAANTLGTALGLFPALLHRGRIWGAVPALKSGARIPLLLLAAWAAYKLYPYIPGIGLRRYWYAIRPVLDGPAPSAANIFRHLATWSAAAAAIGGVVDRKDASRWFLAFAGVVMLGKILVIGGSLTLAELVGIGLAFLIVTALAGHRAALATACALLLGVQVILSRLDPWQWLATPRPFGWVPLLSLMMGSTNVDILSFLEKFFLYGGLIWLLRECGMRLGLGIIAVALLLFATSWAERYQPGRSAEITDAILALIFGIGFALLDDRAQRKS